MKVDVLPFLIVSGTLGLPIVCKFEEWKRFAQLLVSKPHTCPIVPDLNLIGGKSLYKKKNLNII